MYSYIIFKNNLKLCYDIFFSFFSCKINDDFAIILAFRSDVNLIGYTGCICVCVS